MKMPPHQGRQPDPAWQQKMNSALYDALNAKPLALQGFAVDGGP